MSIVLKDLTKRFGHAIVVHNVSMEIEDGELFVLLGGSGSGKSTILRMIAGLAEPDAGRIELDGKDVTYQPPQARGTGFVFQNYSIFRHMTAAENVDFGLRIRKVSTEERRQRAEELLDLVGLTGLGARYADQLSGGQQQRVALARALAYRPAVLLLDEPFGALDVKIRAQLRKSLKDIQKQLKVTTILVTHDQEEAFELADRIGVIERGRLIEVGSPEELYHRPHDEFTATFIGGGNVLVGRKKGDHIRLGGTMLPMRGDAPPHEEGAPVRILFRPETVAVQPQPFEPKGGMHVLGQCQVVEQVFSGSLVRTVLSVEDLRGVRPLNPPPAYGQATTHIVAVQTSIENQVQVLSPGQPLWIALQEYHILDPTGLKILIFSDATSGGEAATDAGCRLAQAAGGPVTLLDLVDRVESIPKARERLEKLDRIWQQHIPLLDNRVRQGGAEEILFEALEGDYELVVIGLDEYEPAAQGFKHNVRELSLRSGIAVLTLRSSRPSIQRILICTAGGEPGKGDIRFGGRIARRANAEATVFHVYRSGADEFARRRIDRHLAQALASLESLGVRCAAKTEEGPVIERILNEARQGDYDLIVIGASERLRPTKWVQTDFTSQIISATRRPVLVVPMVML